MDFIIIQLTKALISLMQLTVALVYQRMTIV